MRNLFGSLLCLLLLCSACGNSKEKQLLKQIQELEANASLAKSDTLIKSYKSFAAEFPKHPKAAGYLYKAARGMVDLNQITEAAKLFELYYTSYKDSSNAEEALFYAASFREQASDAANARRLSYEYLKAFPQGKRAEDVRNNVELIGLTPEQQLDIVLKRKAKADSTAVQQQNAATSAQ